MDWSAIISGIALVAAVASPILTAKVNNNFQLKMKNIELYQVKRMAAFENYFKYVSVRLGDYGLDDERKYMMALGELGLYLPQKLRKRIEDLDIFITEPDITHDQARMFWQTVISEITEYYTSTAELPRQRRSLALPKLSKDKTHQTQTS